MTCHWGGIGGRSVEDRSTMDTEGVEKKIERLTEQAVAAATVKEVDLIERKVKFLQALLP